MELSTGVVRAAVRGLVFDSAGANDRHGLDATGHYRGPASAADGVWPRDRFSLRLKHIGRDGWRGTW